MRARSVSFDDDNDDELFVFSGNDSSPLTYDLADFARARIAERSELDKRRGLVIAQVAVLEDLIDEFILYLIDPIDIDADQGTARPVERSVHESAALRSSFASEHGRLRCRSGTRGDPPCGGQA